MKTFILILIATAMVGCGKPPVEYQMTALEGAEIVAKENCGASGFLAAPAFECTYYAAGNVERFCMELPSDVERVRPNIPFTNTQLIYSVPACQAFLDNNLLKSDEMLSCMSNKGASFWGEENVHRHPMDIPMAVCEMEVLNRAPNSLQ